MFGVGQIVAILFPVTIFRLPISDLVLSTCDVNDDDDNNNNNNNNNNNKREFRQQYEQAIGQSPGFGANRIYTASEEHEEP